jgi:type I restriction enzyme S subunit
MSEDNDIPNGWIKTTLGNVTTKIGSGATPRGGAEAYKAEGISLVRSQNILDFDFSYNGLAFIDDEQANKLSNVTLEKNDVLINITGDSVARVCMIPPKVLPARVNQHVAIVRTDDSKMSQHYLLYYLLNPQFKKYLLRLASDGATRNALTKSDIQGLNIVYPKKLEEQKAIADILSSFDNKIELLQAQNKTLETTAQTIFKEWFGKYQIGDDLPDGWREYQLSELVTTINGYSYKGKELVEESTEALVTLKSFDRNGGFQTRGFKPFKGKPKATQEVQIGDLVVAHTDLTQDADVLGNPAFIFDNGGFNKMFITMDLVKVISKNKEISSSFLYYLMKDRAFKGHCVGYSNGTTVLHLSKKAIPEYQVVLPNNFSKVKEFSEIANATTNKISLNKDEIKTLTQTRDTLLPKLMSGQLRVNEFKESSL